MADFDKDSYAGSQTGAGGGNLPVDVREGAPPDESVPREVGGGVMKSDATISSQGATVLGMNSNFRTTPRNIAELKDGVVLARRVDRGKKGSKTYLAIHKAATTPLKDKLLGARFLNATNESGERMNKNKSIQEDVTSNLRALQPILDQLMQYDCDHVFKVPTEKSYSEFGRTFQDRWNMGDPDFEAVDISKHWARLSMAHIKLWQKEFNLFAENDDLTSSNWVQELIEVMLDPEVKRSQVNQDSEGAISRGKVEVGDFVSTDQFICQTPGRLPTGFGREGPNGSYQGGTIYNDAASGLIYVENQVSLGAGETIMGKERFEQWLYDIAYVEVKHFHGDNGIFASKQYRQECTEKGQTQSFSGVGGQHQNAKAERAIQTIMYMARTFMVHASLHWTEQGVDDISLWPFAVKHAVWLYNRVPNRESGLTPIKLITKQKADHTDILRSHVWGCPAYVLEPKLQNGQKLPKWNRRSRLGQFLGYSDEHSSLVANIRHLKTGYVSPQYHVVFDDLFQTVFSAGPNNELIDAMCEELFNTSSEVYATDEYDAADNLVYCPPPLDEVWLDDEGRRQSRDELRRQRARNDAQMRAREKSARDKASAPTPGGPAFAPPTSHDNGAVISDSEDDSSVHSISSESEGGGYNNNAYDDYDDSLPSVPPPFPI